VKGISPRAAALTVVLVVLVLAHPGVGPGLQAGKGARIEDRIRGRQIAALSPPLERPAVRAVAAATHMRDADLVFGVSLAGQDRAYPWWVVKNYHVVDDVVGGVPMALAFCEQCSGAAAFRRTLDGRVLVFEVAGVYNGTIILRDRQTRSLWAPFSGRALEGPLAGRKLDRLPLSFTGWDEWTARHPRGEVVWAAPSAREGHGSWYEPGKWGIVSEMGSTLQAWDPRLPENELVYGIEGDGIETDKNETRKAGKTEKAETNGRSREDSLAVGKAYPLRWLRERKGIVNDAVGGVPIVVVASGPLDVAAYDRRAGGRELTFRPPSGSQAVMTDEETGTDWSGEGEALAGALQGQRLKPLDGYVVEWHVWAAYHPDAEVAHEEVARVPTVATSELPVHLSFPAMFLTGLDGQPHLMTFPSSVNLVILWAAWCPPCQAEMPRIDRLVADNAGRGLSAVGIAIHIPDEDEREVVRRFVSESRLRFPNLLVDEAAYDRLESLCRQAGGPGLVLPTIFVVDDGGRVRSVLRGKGVDDLPRVVEELLARAKAADR
jgi:thiol-disulfide isomerase/thioredoxin